MTVSLHKRYADSCSQCGGQGYIANNWDASSQFHPCYRCSTSGREVFNAEWRSIDYVEIPGTWPRYYPRNADLAKAHVEFNHGFDPAYVGRDSVHAQPLIMRG